MQENHYITYLNKFSFYIRKAASETMPKNWKLAKRSLFDHELIFVEQGKIVCSIENSVYTINQNEILLIPPGKIHSFTTEGKRLVQPHLHFDFFYNENSLKTIVSFGIIPEDSFLLSDRGDRSLIQDNIYDALNLPYKIVLDALYAQTVKQLIYKLIELQLSNNVLSILESKRYMLEIFEIILTKYLPNNNKTSRVSALFNLINIMIDRQVNQKFDLKKIALEVGYSPNYLSYIYREKFGMTPAQAHTELRIEKAKSYLTQDSLSVTEISDSLGFQSISEFSRYFKKHVGTAPQNYRKQLKRERRG